MEEHGMCYNYKAQRSACCHSLVGEILLHTSMCLITRFGKTGFNIFNMAECD